MRAEIYPSIVQGTIKVPASKSITQRALALALLHWGKTTIVNSGNSEDEKTVFSIIGQLGCDVKYSGTSVEVTGLDNIDFRGDLDCGESGLALRLFTFICSLSSNVVTLSGSGSLVNREMNSFEKILVPLGAQISTHNGKIPVEVKGPIVPVDITVDGSDSSQYISGLLIALAYATNKSITINLSKPVSIPFIDITIKAMRDFGYKVERQDNKIFILPGTKKHESLYINIESDWSNAAFWIVAAALSGKLYLKGLNFNSLQGDRSLIDIIGQCGITVKSENGVLIVEKPHFLYSFHCDATHTPDLFPPLVVLAAYCNGISTIKGVYRLANKESNRAKVLIEVFTHLGTKIWIEDDRMMIEGPTVNGGVVHSHGDHRIAMAASIAALRAKNPVTVNGAEAVMKSYPDFFTHMKSIGVQLILKDD